MKTIILFLVASLFLVGCSSTGDRRNPIASIAVQYAVAKVVDKNTEKAQRVLAIVSETRKLIAGEQASTVAMLEQIVRDQIEWSKLDAADAVLVNALIDEVRFQLEDRLGDSELVGDKVLVVDEVLGWVERAAGMLAR